MTNELRAEHKGLIIVPGASWSASSPYTASYSIFKPHADDSMVVHHGFVGGTFQSQEDAWTAAEGAARDLIDALAERTPTE